MAGQEHEAIAVIGMACRFAGGSNSPSKLWDLLRSPRNLSRRVPADRFDITGFHHVNGSQHGATDATNAYFLEEDINRFDNTFFNIQPAEAEAIDPQQRLVMEVVYDSLCCGGQTIENLRGSNTAVYLGVMCDDWCQVVHRDWDLLPTYAATGTSRAIMSNRISYFFDWHGPSATIDTACSSSLVAVHQAISALRSGESPVAVAAGANLMLAPGMFIAESSLHMLSPTGTCKMWDAGADGYARGDGIAAVVLKPLSAALRDGDPIDCIIRGTGVNQDGKTAGLTMPNNLSQAKLIRDTYARAGLDINDPKDRPQFFQAHGTGTLAGDPQEAEAISRAFFGEGKAADKLYVGSVKTVIGHTEGAAGLAGFIGSAMAMRHGTIPPNLHMKNLSPRVAPFYSNLEVSTTARPWPETLPGQPRRASINSFGFGGTNAHVILESYEPAGETKKATIAAVPVYTPLTISAASPATLRTTLDDLRIFLEANPSTNIRDLAYTLQARRSTLAYRKSIIAINVEEALRTIEGLLVDNNNASDRGLTTRYPDVSKPSILGVFTGQGAQWPRMGALLIESSPFATRRIAELQRALSTLPEDIRPDWTLYSQLRAGKTSRLDEAAIAQPLCTAVQILLVDLLRAAKIQLRAVVGHSSGEIGAAYAAGFLSAVDAIRVSYYRGLCAKLACSPSGGKGAMIAVGTSFEDAERFCRLEQFAGRVQVAARNSFDSITLSGDEEAIEEAVSIFKDEGKFARRLRVDTAYHSKHMLPCAASYLADFKKGGYTVGDGNGTIWFSSVVEGGRIMTKNDILDPQYWVDNMTSAVLFAPAITQATVEAGPFDIAIECGPHPALKGPALDTMKQVAGHKIPYTGLLARNKNDVDELASALGFIWTHLGALSVDFYGFEKQVSGTTSTPKRVVADLPTYPFDHSISYGSLTRFSGSHKHAHTPPHPLLGRRMVETETADEITWRNVLRPTENGWLQGHALQGQSVFPAMGYVSMAVEAIRIAAKDRRLGLITLKNLVIGRAMAFSDDNAGIETKVILHTDSATDDKLSARIACYSGLPYDGATSRALNFNAVVTAVFYEPEPDTLPATRRDEINLVEADSQRLYSQFTKLGYNYNSPFTGVRTIQRKTGWATGEIQDESGNGWEDNLLVHPGWLDSAIQTGFAAYSHPWDNRLFTLLVPTAIDSIAINPYFFDDRADHSRTLQYQTSVRRESSEFPMIADIDVFLNGKTATPSHPFVQLGSIKVRPFAPATARDDAILFSRLGYQLAEPNAIEAVEKEQLLPSEAAALLRTFDRVMFFYLRQLHKAITPDERAAALPRSEYLLEYADRLVAAVTRGENPTIPREALADSPAFVRSLIVKHYNRADMRMVEVVGEHLADEVRWNGSLLEHMTKDGLLERFYAEAAGVDTVKESMAKILAQIAHRYPRMNVFEVGAGTGSTTRPMLSALNGAFSSYTFTDIQSQLITDAQNSFMKTDFSERMTFATFDVEQSAKDQGFEQAAYDVVIASNVLHTTGRLDEAMAEMRYLLRPGGFLIVLEVVRKSPVVMNTMIGGTAEWWTGSSNHQSRKDGPCLTLDRWDALTRRYGFSGVDTHTPVVDKAQWFSVFISQAVDDRINSLRAPLAAPALTLTPDQTNNTTQLVIIGGSTPAVAKLAEALGTLFTSHYAAVTRFQSLEELNQHGLTPGSSVLSLTELDEQFLETRSQSKLEALKLLWRNGGSVLLVTRSACDEHPFSSITLGLCRVVRLEYPHLNLQVFDFDAATEVSPQKVGEAFMQLELGALFEKKAQKPQILWTMEPEVHYKNGQLYVPRLLPDKQANKRYNSYRRAVDDTVDPRKAAVVLEPASSGLTFELAIASPLRVLRAPQETPEKMVTVQVEQSLLQVVNVRGAGYFTLFAGEDVGAKGERFVAFSDAAIESHARVPSEWTVRVPSKMDKNALATSLASVGAYVLGQSILAAAPSFGTVLVHEADKLLKKALDREATRKGVRVIFTTAEKKNNDTTATDHSPPYVFIHPELPARLVQLLLPRDVSFLVDLSSKSTADADFMTRAIPPYTTKATTADFLRMRPGLSSEADVKQIGQMFKAAWQAVTNQRLASSSTLRDQITLLPLQDIASFPVVRTKLSIIDWTASSSVQALVRPIDHGIIFRADGTYLLVGLTGDLGQSLCAWMVAHGARHVVLGSRNPKVKQQFVDSLTAEGATIKVMAIDITNRGSLHAAYDTIRAEMPPVIGVANGAMLMHDSLFEDLDLESLERTIPPKIEGTRLLDELFYDAPLDFFILFSSLSSVVGNGGQSAYVMANQFLAALAAQRRDVRGVAGSDMGLSAVLGLGYFEHATHLGDDHFRRLGFRNMSAEDLHEHFAEAMLAGRPGAKGSSEVVTGVLPFRDSPETYVQLRTSPRFNHFFLHEAGAVQNSGGDGKTERPRTRLAAAKSRDEALATVREAFIVRLKHILMIPPGTSVNEDVTFVEQGIDSIMAVEIRAWFLQELDVDLPVLKVLGAGSTVQSLLGEVIDNIPVAILDVKKLESGGEETAAAPATLLTAAFAPAPDPTNAPVAATTPVAVDNVNAVNDALTPYIEQSAPMETSSSPSVDSPRSTSTIFSPVMTPLEITPLETPMETPPESSVDSYFGPNSNVEQEKKLEESRRQEILSSATEIAQQMTFGQKCFWFLDHYVEDRTALNIACLFKLTGNIRVHDLATAVEATAQRHEALRTRFFWSDDGTKTPMQGILSKAFLRLETTTIETKTQATEELEAMRNHKWDLGDWVQLRLRLLSLSDTVHFLILGAHHISVDGHSISMLLLDINQSYNRRGRPLPPLTSSSQARAFGEQQFHAYRSGRFYSAIDHYRRALGSMDLTRPIELLPFARPQVRRSLTGFDNHVSRIRLDVQTAARLKQLVRSHRATPFHAYLAALQALIFRLLPSETTEKLIIGIADANRLDNKFMNSIGNFLNVVPLIFDRESSGNRHSFAQAVEEARNKVYNSLEHSGLPFDILLDELAVPRNGAYTPVFQIFMDYKLVSREQAEMNLLECKINKQKWHTAKSSYDIALEIIQDHESAEVIAHMQATLYSKEASELFLRSYVNLLVEAVKQSSHEMSIEKLEKWSQADVKTALQLGNGPDLPFEWPATVPHRIDQVIAQHLNDVAVKDGFGNVLTYAALDERAESIARVLRGILPDQNRQQSVVGVFQTPAADWIASMIAIFRVGAIYLPLDLKVSTARLKGYADVARPAVILTDHETAEYVREINVEDTAAVINISGAPFSVEGSKERIATAAQPDRPAYIIFTSGSTGVPKGVVIKHASFHAMAEGYVREWDVATHSRAVLQQFPLTSDGSLKQIVSALTTGGCLVVAPASARGDPSELTRLIAEFDVTMAVATPSEWSMWLSFAPNTLRSCTSLTSAWFGGERASEQLLKSFRDLGDALPNLRFLHTYGPTEAAISTAKGEADVRDPNLAIPIPSRILPNYAVYILDDELQPVPVGVPGEIVIGGAGVGENEYLNRMDLTAKQFPADPFASQDKKTQGWGRMYRTGDYGRLDALGRLTIEGRINGDAQVKVRGFRVELGEIESVILQQAANTLATAVVTLREGDGDHDGLLAAHIVVKNNEDMAEERMAEFVDKLRTRLSVALPQYMVPAVIVPVKDIPLTINGKIDRKAVQALSLPDIKTSIAGQQDQQQKNLTSNERRLAEIWATILPSHSMAAMSLTPQSNFFLAGGNSLLLVKLQAAITQAFGDAPRLFELMKTSQLGNMAMLLESGSATPDWDKEIALDSSLLKLQLPTVQQQQTLGTKGSGAGLRVAVTGATGALGKRLIPQLAADNRVAQIVVLARPAEGRDLDNLFPGLENKVRVMPTELPFLPSDGNVTDAATELADIDVIVHVAGDRNFWDGYSALKPVNVDAAKALAQLALRIGATLHVLSSGVLADYEAADDNSNNNSLPRPDAADGYIASKWVAERYLANVARHTGLQITAHRPTKAPTEALDSQALMKPTEAEIDLVRNFVLLSTQLGLRPDFAHVGGTFHIAPVHDVAAAIATIVTADHPQASNGKDKALHIVNHPGTASVRAEIMATYGQEVFNRPENKAVLELPAVPALHWVGRAKRAGLFEWFFTAQELVARDKEGQRMVSRR